ncbi:MAG: DUF6220 domain-containing protein [Nitrososphaerota archaeon]
MAHTETTIPAPTRPTSAVGLARYGRIAFISVTGLLLVAIAFQVFLAGLSIFAGATWWQVHMLAGSLIGILPILLIGLALLGRLPRAFLLVSALLLGQVILQVAFIEIGANAGAPWFAALHPVNALAIFVVSLVLFQRARRTV